MLCILFAYVEDFQIQLFSIFLLFISNNFILWTSFPSEEYMNVGGVLPKVTDVNVRFLRLVTDLHLSTNQADAVSR